MSQLARIALQLVCLLALSAAAGWATWHHLPEPPPMHVADTFVTSPWEVKMADIPALERTAGGIHWVDARIRREYEKEHVPGAILVNEYEWENTILALVEKVNEHADWPVVIYCDAQACKASHELRERILRDLPLGGADIRTLAGGWPAWKSAASSR